DKIEVLNFLSSAFNELARRNEGGDVPAHPLSPGMRMIGDNRNQLRFDRGINLNLRVAVVRVPIHVLDRLLGGADPHLRRTGQLSGAVDDSSLQDSGSKLTGVVEARDALQKAVRII